MENLFIDATLINSEESHCFKGDGVKNGNVISYNEDLIMASVSFNNDEIILIRKHPEYEMTLRFDRKKRSRGIYIVNNENFDIETETVTKKMIINDSKIEVVYDFYLGEENLGEYIYTLNYEVKK